MTIKKNDIALLFHIKEIQLRLYYCIFSFFCTLTFCYILSFEILYMCMKPFLPYTHTYMFFDLTEAFSITMTLCFFSSLFFSSFYCFYSFCCFLFSSFYDHEKKKYIKNCSYFFVSLIISVIIIYYLLLPCIYRFFIHYQIQSPILSIQFEARISSYIFFTFKTIVLLLSLLQIPSITYFLYAYNYITPKSLARNRKYFAFFFLLLASIISPPDIFYQIIFFIILFFYYECIIYYGFVYFVE